MRGSQSYPLSLIEKTVSTIYRNLIASNLFPFIHNLESFIFQDVCQYEEFNQKSIYFEGGSENLLSVKKSQTTHCP